MIAACTRCTRVWNISTRTSPAGYVCPDCDLRQRYIAAGVIRPAEAGGGRREGGTGMDRKVIEALKQLDAALEKAGDTEGNTVAELNAYFVMQQEVQNAANHCAQALHWARKEEKSK